MHRKLIYFAYLYYLLDEFFASLEEGMFPLPPICPATWNKYYGFNWVRTHTGYHPLSLNWIRGRRGRVLFLLYPTREYLNQIKIGKFLFIQKDLIYFFNIGCNSTSNNIAVKDIELNYLKKKVWSYIKYKPCYQVLRTHLALNQVSLDYPPCLQYCSAPQLRCHHAHLTACGPFFKG